MSVTQRIAGVLRSGGLNAKAAAGVIGNSVGESSENPASVGDGGGGLWGFTSGAISLGSLQGFAKAHGAHWTDPVIQTKFLLAHMTPGDISALNSQPTARGAAAWFMNNWEHPYAPTEHAGVRMDAAEQALKEIKGVDPAMAQQARGRSGIPGQPKTTSQTITDPGVTTKTTSGGGLDVKSAVLNALLTPTPINTTTGTPPASGSLLSRVMANVNSGAYTTPVVNTISKSAGQSTTITNKTIAKARAMGGTGQQGITNQAVNDAAAAGVNSDAQHLLKMLHNVNGSAYSQGNHNAIDERDVNIKAEGTDCSGLISWLMGPHGLNIWKTSLATPSINTAPGIQAGKGREVTIWNNNQAGNAGHVFIQVGTGKNAQFWASEGGVGVHQLPLSEVQNYIQNGSDGGHYVALHPKGL